MHFREELRVELRKLEHALAWYRNGERYGWQRTREQDDLSPATAPEIRLPSPAQLESVYRSLDVDAIAARTAQVEDALSEGDWRVRRLRWETEELRARCLVVRQEVEGYAWLYPDHPPPPAIDEGAMLAVAVTAVLGGFWAMMMLLAALVGAA